MSTKGQQQKDFERERVAAAAESQPMQIQVTKTIGYSAFLVGDVIALPDGTKIVQFITVDGTVHQWPLAEANAKALGERLTAPSIEIASAAEMPPAAAAPNGNGGGRR